MKKITEQHIQQLYKFTRAHFVEHFDVQTELVDHLANDIEAIWQEKPNLTFDEAKTMSFKKFGVFGFMEMYEARQNALSKKYMIILWEHTKAWFKFPKIIATFTLYIFYFYGLKSEYSEYFYLFIFGTLLVFGIAKGIFLIRKIKKKQKETNQKWLLEDIIYRGTFVVGLMLFVNLHNIISLGNIDSSDQHFSLIFAFIFTFLTIWEHLSLNVLPQKSKQLLQKQYPEYKLVSKA